MNYYMKKYVKDGRVVLMDLVKGYAEDFNIDFGSSDEKNLILDIIRVIVEYNLELDEDISVRTKCNVLHANTTSVYERVLERIKFLKLRMQLSDDIVCSLYEFHKFLIDHILVCDRESRLKLGRMLYRVIDLNIDLSNVRRINND